MQPLPPAPAPLIMASGKTLMRLAIEADLSLDCVFRAKQRNRWPAQRRTRLALARVLGLAADPATGHSLPAVGQEVRP